MTGEDAHLEMAYEDQQAPPIEHDEEGQAEMDRLIFEDGIVISEHGSGYSIVCFGTLYATTPNTTDVDGLVVGYCNANGVWPDIYWINERGNVEEYTVDNDELQSTGRGWV